MANSIAFAKNYVSVIDEVYQRAGVSGVLNSGRRMVRAGHNAKEILIPKISVTGLGNYTRNVGYKTCRIRLFSWMCAIRRPRCQEEREGREAGIALSEEAVGALIRARYYPKIRLRSTKREIFTLNFSQSRTDSARSKHNMLKASNSIPN